MATPPKMCGDCNTQMNVEPGLYALTGLERTPEGFAINANRALPVTAYLCPNCGRYKFISAMILGNLNPEPDTI